MEKYANENTIIKNECYEAFKDSIICPICQSLILEPFACLECLNSICKKCVEKKKICPNQCENSKFKQLNGKNNLIEKFKFKCIKGCDEEILLKDLEKHYSSDCLSKITRERAKTLTPKEAAKYTKKSGNNIPTLTSMYHIIIYIIFLIVITLGFSGVGKSSLIST